MEIDAEIHCRTLSPALEVQLGRAWRDDMSLGWVRIMRRRRPTETAGLSL